MQCDMIFASAESRFGFPGTQPYLLLHNNYSDFFQEIKLGTIPGAGGTQRLTKAIGKQKVRTPFAFSISTNLKIEEKWLLVLSRIRSTNRLGDGDDINRHAHYGSRNGAFWGSESHLAP
jgi:hypothetical protein